MGTFEDILNKAKRGAEVVGQKTGDFVEVTKLKMAASDLDKEIAATYEGLGRLVYDAQKSDEDVSEMIQDCIDSIDELQEAADAIREQIYSYKNVHRCVACGAIVDKDSAFCPKCGAPLTVEEEAPAEPAEEATEE